MGLKGVIVIFFETINNKKAIKDFLEDLEIKDFNIKDLIKDKKDFLEGLEIIEDFNKVISFSIEILTTIIFETFVNVDLITTFFYIASYILI